MNRAARAAATLCLLALAASLARAQPPAAPEPAGLRGESAQTRKRLLEVEAKMAAGKHADAADDLQRLLDESGGDLILVEPHRARPARWAAHALFARLDRDALKAYQDRVDQPARKLLAQAKDGRDERPLHQLLDRYYASRPGNEGLLLLGDLLFERGEFRAAEAAWRQLLPDGGAELTHPNPPTDLAPVRARVVLAAIYAGDASRARAEFTAFKEKHPNAAGALAGQTGPLADVLRKALDAPPQLAPEAPSREWPTFGGSPARAGRAPGGLPRDWTGRPQVQRLPVPPVEPPVPAVPAVGPPARPPLGHPVVMGGAAFVADATRVFRFDLRTGQSSRVDPQTKTAAPVYVAPLAQPQPANSGEKTPPPPLPPACASLTAADGRLYARFGPPVVRSPDTPGGKESSYLVCLRPDPGELTAVWRLAPPEEKAPAAWEGAPVVAGGRLWAVYAKFEGGRAIHVAACYDPVAGDAEPSRPAWTTELCESAHPVSGDGRARQELLTLAGGHLVFNSNTGAVVALDAVTGQRAWAFRYPRRRGGAAPDPAPAAAFGGRVFVAPADGERVYALDAGTGQVVWESGPLEGARILGVARGKLIVSAAGPYRSLRGLNLGTGSHRDGGWVQAADLAYGQGLVTDDAILWPSRDRPHLRDGLLFVDPETGRRTPGGPNPLPGAYPFAGNLAYADGVLVAVGHGQVWFYRASGPPPFPRPDSTPADRFYRVADRAERALAAGDRAAGLVELFELATSDLPPALRAWAAARLVQMSPPASDRNGLPALVQSALRPALMSEWLLNADGLPVTLDTFVRQRLGEPLPAASVPVAGAHRPCAAVGAEPEVAHTVKLPPGVSPLPPVAGAGRSERVFAAGPGVLVTVPSDRGAMTAHTAPELFTHASDLAGGFVAAGPTAVALYGAARDPLWVFRLPATERLTEGALPFALRGGESPAVYLSSFRLVGSWLLLRAGAFHLIALDLGAKRVAWVLGATGPSGYDPCPHDAGPRFGPHVAVGGGFVVAQLSDGRRWFVKLETGRLAPQPALGERTARVWWPNAPVELGDGRLVLADGPGTVRLLQPGGRVRWCFEVEHADGLAGEPPQVRLFGDSLVVAVRRNHGVELECLNADDGKPLWDPVFIDADRVDLSAADANGVCLFLPVGGELLALDREGGKVAWRAKLPDAGPAGWVARHAGEGGVVVCPREAVPAEPTGIVLGRLATSFRRDPQVWRLPGLALTLYDAWVDRAAPVLAFDHETGARTARLDLPGRGPAVIADLDADRSVIATGDRVVWLK